MLQFCFIGIDNTLRKKEFSIFFRKLSLEFKGSNFTIDIRFVKDDLSYFDLEQIVIGFELGLGDYGVKDVKELFARLVLQPIISPISNFAASVINPNAPSAQGNAASSLGVIGNGLSAYSTLSSLGWTPRGYPGNFASRGGLPSVA